jgi:hypothetical protein
MNLDPHIMESPTAFFELGAIVFGLTEVLKAFFPKNIRSKAAHLSLCCLEDLETCTLMVTHLKM